MLYFNKNSTSKTTKQKFNDLMKDFNLIFPDGNRNAGGAQFFKHIYEKNLTKSDFFLYNTFYCGVSGSPIDPDRQSKYDYVQVTGRIPQRGVTNNTGEIIYGKYYRCCWPCICDIMRHEHVIVEKFNAKLKNGNFDVDVLTISDPCKNKNKIPQEITSWKCNDSNMCSNCIHTKSGRVIIALLHSSTKNKPKQFDNSIKICTERNNTLPDNLQGGMGDLFVKLSSYN